MDLNSLSVFNAAKQNLGYLSERQKVLAENVANANTPRYLPKDVERPDFAGEVRANLAMRTTNSKHFSASPSKMSGYKVYTPKPTSPLSMDGNGVVLEEQLNEASKNSSEHNRVLTIYSKYRDLVKLSNTKISG